MSVSAWDDERESRFRQQVASGRSFLSRAGASVFAPATAESGELGDDATLPPPHLRTAADLLAAFEAEGVTLGAAEGDDGGWDRRTAVLHCHVCELGVATSLAPTDLATPPPFSAAVRAAAYQLAAHCSGFAHKRALRAAFPDCARVRANDAERGSVRGLGAPPPVAAPSGVTHAGAVVVHVNGVPVLASSAPGGSEAYNYTGTPHDTVGGGDARRHPAGGTLAAATHDARRLAAHGPALYAPTLAFATGSAVGTAPGHVSPFAPRWGRPVIVRLDAPSATAPLAPLGEAALFGPVPHRAIAAAADVRRGWAVLEQAAAALAGQVAAGEAAGTDAAELAAAQAALADATAAVVATRARVLGGAPTAWNPTGAAYPWQLPSARGRWQCVLVDAATGEGVATEPPVAQGQLAEPPLAVQPGARYVLRRPRPGRAPTSARLERAPLSQAALLPLAKRRAEKRGRTVSAASAAPQQGISHGPPVSH